MAQSVSNWFAAAGLVAALAGPASGAGEHRTAATAAVAHDGPFGIALGEPVADLGPVQDLGNGNYIVLHPPRSNPQIARVMVQAFPSTGVCNIDGTSDAFANDPNAVRAKQLVDDLASSLAVKYGAPTKKVDDCDDSAGGCDTFLTLKISQHAARYGYGWNFDGALRADHIGIIGAMVQTDDGVSTTADVGYLSDRTDACQKAEAAAGAAGL